jgi:membrane-bound lytic murein transglycosylase D
MEDMAMELRRLVSKARSRVIYGSLAVAMGVSTVVAGLSQSTYLTHGRASDGHSVMDELAVLENDMPALADSVIVGRSSSRRELDLDLEHRRIDSWVHRLTTSLRGDFSRSLARMDKYEPMITRELDERQMPRELIYLAMIESNFNPNARSRVGAVGMWQFMSATARQFGLTVRGRKDERKNPTEATEAALTYLDQLHKRFGSWYLAAAAYNSGEGTVSKALKKVTGKKRGTDADFFRILPALPKETQDYVPKLIASARVGSDPERYGFSD